MECTRVITINLKSCLTHDGSSLSLSCVDSLASSSILSAVLGLTSVYDVVVLASELDQLRLLSGAGGMVDLRKKGIVPLILAKLKNEQAIGTGHTFLWAGQMVASIEGFPITVHRLSEHDLFDLDGASQAEIITEIRSKERAFNHLEFDSELVTKVVADREKGRAEWSFFQALEPKMKRFFPEVLDFKVSSNEFTYRLAKIPCFDLATIYVHGALSPEKFLIVLDFLRHYFASCTRKPVEQKVWLQKSHDLLIDKLEKRFAALVQIDSAWQNFRVTFQGRDETLSGVIDRLIQEISAVLAMTQGPFELIWSHGDLSFSNLLFDDLNSKLVDPRGIVDADDYYQPEFYDLAKLAHCVFGNFDGLMAERSPAFSHQQRSFERLLDATNVSPGLLALAEASLFFSLLPLHIDSPKTIPLFISAGVAAFERGILSCAK